MCRSSIHTDFATSLLKPNVMQSQQNKGLQNFGILGPTVLCEHGTR